MRAPQEIAATFDRAYNMTRASKLGSAEQARVCHEYALFADSHYQALSSSPELDRLRANRDRTMSELEHIESTSKSSKSKSASAKTEESRRQDVLEDERALQDLEQELATYARTAMKMYATSLATSNEFDDSVTRLCSMWLEHDDSEEVNRTFAGPVQAIPTYKFIFLGPQLAARLYKPKQATSFNSALNGLLLRMARDHPYHIIYQIITVAQGADAAPGKGSKSRRPSESISGEGRIPAAQEVLSILHSDTERPLAKEAVDRMMYFTNAAVPWCLHNEPEKKSSRSDYQMAKGTPLLSIVNTKIPPPSVVPPVDLTKRYQSIATIQRYRSTYKILGGIHRPKRMTCIDSLGRHHFELVRPSHPHEAITLTEQFKGDDELRQDAVMEQVFEMTNRILSRDRKTRARDLRFRRYTVIPLPARSGIMEFVGDSQAIGEFLKPAHTR
jgi:ataxia telangiectasia mutated family protein